MVNGSSGSDRPARVDDIDVLDGIYQLERELSRGGMGRIWLATNLVLGTRVAIKLLVDDAGDSSAPAQRRDDHDRFRQEALAAAALRHPNVVEVLDAGVDHGRPYLVMELLDGETLRARLDRDRALDPRVTSAIVDGIAAALTAAHAAGIVHRDLKPDNVFLVGDAGAPVAKVLDFGVAKLASGSALVTTASGAAMGTPAYMSPEQAQGARDVDAASDRWALGVVAFECLTGRRPFEADSLGELVLQICAWSPPVPSAHGEVPAGFDAWFATACARERGDRFASADEQAAALARICASAATDPSTTTADALADTVSDAEPATGGEPLAPGKTIGRYRLERVLGAGGMGVVHAAHDPDLDRRIALKLRHGRGAGDTDARGRFLREARAMAKIRHANVITVHEVGTAAGVDYVAMELIDGGNLAEWLRRAPRPAAEVLRRFHAAGRGLAAAHATGLVHRDFKPANVMVGDDGQVVVTDFGLARAFADDAGATDGATDVAATNVAATDDTVGPAGSLTRTGAVVGTPAYMAPEQLAGASTGPAADQYAFAVALWEALAGTRPFVGATVDELRRAIARGVTTGGDRIPRRIRAVLERALAFAPAARWPSVDGLLAALERAERRPRRLALAAAAVVIAGAVAAAIVVTSSRGVTTRPAVSACAISDTDLDQAWSPRLAAAIADHFDHDPAWARQAAVLDGFAASWRTERAATCVDPTARLFHGRVACLLSMRDEVAALMSMAEDLPIEVLRTVQIAEVLPDPIGCRSGVLAARPPLPDDPTRRAAISAAHRDAVIAIMTARSGNLDRGRFVAAALLDRARRLDEPMVSAIALRTAAVIEHTAENCAAAEPYYADAATAADRAQAGGMRAVALLGQLECVISQATDLAAARDLAAKAEAAIAGAGGDRTMQATLVASLGGIAARAGDLDTAIERTGEARATFAGQQDARRQAMQALNEAELRRRRHAPDDAARVVELLREAVGIYEGLYGPDHAATVDAGAQLDAELRRAIAPDAAPARPPPQESP